VPSPVSWTSSHSILWVRQHPLKLPVTYPSLNVLLCAMRPCCISVCSRCCRYSSFDGRVTRVLVTFMGIITLECLSLFSQVKTRVQLERGKTSTSLLSSFRSIIREEGCVHYDSRLSLRQPNSELFVFIASDVSTAVGRDLQSDRMIMTQRGVKRSRSSTASQHRNVPPNRASFYHVFLLPVLSRDLTLPTQRCK
jgi:hypothetical protein